METERLQELFCTAVKENKVHGNNFLSGALINICIRRSEEIVTNFFNNETMTTDFQSVVNFIIDEVREENEYALLEDVSTDDELIGYTKSFIIGVYVELSKIDPSLEKEDEVILNTQRDPLTVDRMFRHMGTNRLESLGEDDFTIVNTGNASIPLLEGEKRKQELNNVSNAIDEALSNRLDSAYEGDNTIHLLKAPTGSGKTSRIISTLVSDPRTYQDIRIGHGINAVNERRPILVLMPNHQNIAEAVARAHMLCLDPDMPDRQLAEALVLCKFSENIDVAFSKLQEARDSIRMCNRDRTLPTLNISVMESRSRAGCKKIKEINLLAKAGIGQASLCKSRSRNQETGNMEDIYCEHYNTCPFIISRQNLKNAHIVFMPHSYLTIESIPEEIENPRIVIIDERIQEQVLKFEFIDLNTLIEPRRRTLDVTRSGEELEPRNEEEAERQLKRRESFVDFQRKEAARSWCAYQLVECANRNIEPAEHFCNLEKEFDNGDLHIEHHDFILPSPLSCLDLAYDALVEVGKKDPRIKPGVNMDLLNVICSTPGSSTISTEKKLWETIKDRILRLRLDIVREAMREEKEGQWLERIARAHTEDKDKVGLDFELAMNKYDMENPVRATGSRDMRMQFLDMRTMDSSIPSRMVRISWREKINWESSPVLLLDASAYEEIVKKIWSHTEVKTTDVVKDFGKLLNVRIVGIIDHAWSNSSLLSSASSSFAQRISSGVALSAIRDATSVISSVHADGRILFGSNKNVREAVQHNWIPPINMDTSHYGAIRGIDVWKYHSATVSVGRMDLPVEILDAMAACLTWDEAYPEEPFNIFGTGFADPECQKPLFQSKHKREIRMRDGRKAIISIPMVDGKWGQLCQKQAREEELLQFLGRLRPIYRTGKTPIHYAFSSVIPEGLILDDCVTIHDIVGDDNTGLLKKGKQENDNNISIRWQRERQENAVITRIIDTAVRIHDGILCPEALVHDYINLDIDSKYRTSENIYNLLRKKGFNLYGEQDAEQSMADGWSLYGYSICGDTTKPVWAMSSVFRTEEETMQAITDLLTENLNCSASDIEIGPFNIVYPERDVAQSLDVKGPELLDRAEKNVHSVNKFIDFMSSVCLEEDETIETLNSNGDLVTTKTGKQKITTFIKEYSCEAMQPYHIARKRYKLSETMADYMAPTSIIMSEARLKREKEIKEQVCNKGLYYHQLMGVMSLQDIFGPSLNEIINKVEGKPGLKQIEKPLHETQKISVNYSKLGSGKTGKYQNIEDINFSEFEATCLTIS